MQEKFTQLKKHLEEIELLAAATRLLAWDQNTYMPPLGAEARGKQLGVLSKLIHEMWTDEKLGRLLDELEPWAKEQPYDSLEASLVRLARRQFDKANRVPSEFISKIYNHLAQSLQAWVKAKNDDDFAYVQPYLERTVELSREYASYFPEAEHIADPLIQERDFGMKASQLKELFAQLRKRLVPLVEQIKEAEQPDVSFLHLHYPKEKQLAFIEQVIQKLGLDFKRARQDLSPHPFMISIAHDDVRITTRVNEHELTDALFSSIHETGHAFYELGIDRSLEGTPLHHGTSSGVHESQSRLWENVIGRSRAFWEYFYPQLQAVFPSQLGNVTLEQFYRAINKVTPSLIRTEADEVTYNLHVIIRFDLELALLEGKLQVKDLPEVWRQRYQSDLGVTPPNDQLGVLQDIHWYHDFVGGVFQGYTIGNILSCQFYAKAKEAYPDLEQRIRQGEFAALYNWLKENIYRHGSKFTADELVKRVTGTDLTIEPYMNYLYSKYQELYKTVNVGV